MSARPRAAVIVALLAALLAGPAAGQDVVDGVVAVVGERPVMWSEVQFDAELRAIEELGGRAGAQSPIRPSVAVFEARIDRLAVLHEVDAEVRAPEEAVNRRLEAFLDRFERVDDLTLWLGRWRISTRELKRHFADDLRADDYLESRIASMARVSDRDVRERLAEEPERWAAMGEAEALATIRAGLEQERRDEQRTRWLAELRARIGVRTTELGRALIGDAP